MNICLKNIINNPFSTAIISWYKQNKRQLPWRESQNPYHIWLSEIILQQTRVAQGLPYYYRFVKKYATVNDLAGASEDEILRLWQGLGYYTRARNLHKCARIVVSEFYGEFPSTMKALQTLPGIGRYTAAAIASQAFNKAVPVVDGNVYRVLARYFGIEQDINNSKAYGYFHDLSLSLMDKTVPGDYNQAVMEFGALCCKPHNPECTSCVLQSGCVAFSKSAQNKLPVKKPRQKSRKRYFHYYIIIHEGKILLRQRNEKDIWQGLYEFPLVEQVKLAGVEVKDQPILAKMSKYNAEFTNHDKIIRHVLTHQVLYVNFAVINLEKNIKLKEALIAEGYNWYDQRAVEELPKPVLLANFLDTYMNSINLQ